MPPKVDSTSNSSSDSDHPSVAPQSSGEDSSDSEDPDRDDGNTQGSNCSLASGVAVGSAPLQYNDPLPQAAKESRLAKQTVTRSKVSNMSAETSRQSLLLLDADRNFNLRAAFFGFSISAILFGITIRQGYEYYVYTMRRDRNIRRLIIGAVFLLDTLHLVFSLNLLYSFIRELLGDSGANWYGVWSLKALASTQVFLILLVQGYYLTQMWLFTRNSLLLQKRYTVATRIFVIIVVMLAVAVAAIFMSQLQRVDVIFGFSPGIEYILYLGFGTTALVDCSIAGAMCVILYKCSSGINTGIARSESVLESLIQYFVGTGLLTSFAAIMVITLYVARPHTLLYLSVEMSVTRLYANSILAMFNARHSLAQRMNQTIELQFAPNIITKDPESSLSRGGIHFSPASETRYSPAGESTRYTSGAGSHGREYPREENQKVSHETERHTL